MKKSCRHTFLIFTFPASSKSALRCKRSFATSRLPYLAATCRGVKPFYKEKEKYVSVAIDSQGHIFITCMSDLPLWQESEMLPPPAAQRPCPAAPHGQRCAEACIRLWWRRRGEPCAAATAARFLSDPGGTRCVGGSGPPRG